MSPCKGISIPESETFLNMESGILCFGIRNTAQKIRNPNKDWYFRNPRRSRSRIRESNPRLFWIPLHEAKIDGAQGFWNMQEIVDLRACLQEGRGPQVGEVTCGKSPHPTCKRDHIKMRDYMDGRVIPHKRVT